MKNLKGDPSETEKKSKKVIQCQKKYKGDPTVSSAYISYVKNDINERGLFALT